MTNLQWQDRCTNVYSEIDGHQSTDIEGYNKRQFP